MQDDAPEAELNRPASTEVWRRAASDLLLRAARMHEGRPSLREGSGRPSEAVSRPFYRVALQRPRSWVERAAGPNRVVALVASAGGLDPLRRIVGALPARMNAAIIVLQHRAPKSRLTELLALRTAHAICEPWEGDRLRPGAIHVAPAGFDMHIDADRRVRYLDAPPTSFVRPSADVLLTSLAVAYGEEMIAVILSGAGSDGTCGSRAVCAAGGLVIAQDESSCEHPEMPRAALELGHVDLVLRVDQMAPALFGFVSC